MINMFDTKDELINYCVDNNLRTTEALASNFGFSIPWAYKLLSKLGVKYKKDITNLIDFNEVVAADYKDWVESCGEQWDEVCEDNWRPYNEGSIEYGESGCRRSVTHRDFKSYPYCSYVFIPDNIPDTILRGCGEDYLTNIEYKYVFISPEGDFFHTNHLKRMCTKLGVKYQSASDCVRGRSVKTNTDWQVKYTKDFYKV